MRRYPTIKYGDPAALEDYRGGRSFDDLDKFTSELKPVCSPANIALCDADQKANIERLQAMSASDLDAEITKGEESMKEAEKTFETEVGKLQAAYQQLQKDKEDAIKKIKDSGLGLMKAVRASRSSKDEL